MNMLKCQKCETSWLEAIRPDCPVCNGSGANPATEGIRQLVDVLREKSVGPEDHREIDAQAETKADERLRLQLESAKVTQELHRRSAEASERSAAAWEDIARSLARLAPRHDR